MQAQKLFCGDALCKAPVDATVTSAGPWPVHCPKCGTALYPADVLTRLPASELEPKRSELMVERGKTRVAVESSQFPSPPKTETGDDDDAVERILALVELDPVGAALKRRNRRRAIKAAIAIGVLVGVVLIVLHGR